MKKRKIKLHNILIKLLIYFVSIFSILSIVFICASGLSGNSYLGSYFSWQIITFSSLLLTVIYYFILKINRITSTLQILLIYFSFILITYLVCFLLRVFSFHGRQNLIFFLISVGITVFVFGVLLLILLYKQRKETKKLNKYLNKFKERDR